MSDVVVYVWEGITGECLCNEIGFVMICVGDIIGEYIVMFVDIGEWVEIIYKVIDWMMFVNGVVKVVIWFVE